MAMSGIKTIQNSEKGYNVLRTLFKAQIGEKLRTLSLSHFCGVLIKKMIVQHIMSNLLYI